jgi:glutamate formiminotransferase / 5-formyltetrahydrofolate cyclo-ligase
VFECVINISEGRDPVVLGELAAAAGPSLRDVHRDGFHHRSVFTLINDATTLMADTRTLITAAFDRLSLEGHVGVHPRLGVVDVVPFVSLEGDMAAALLLRDETAAWLGATFDVPVFAYGPRGGEERTLPSVRREAFTTLPPDHGPQHPHPRWGATAVGARPVLLAWNIELAHTTLARAKELAAAVRGPGVRTLGLATGDTVQVSCNLIDWRVAPPSAVYDAVERRLEGSEVIRRAELVGLVPRAVLDAEDPQRWASLGLSADATIEARTAS